MLASEGVMTSNLRAVAVLFALQASMLALTSAWTPQPRSCESLADARLPNTTITTAERVDSSFTPAGSGNPISNLPPFCRVVGEIAPTVESRILFEVWLPVERWNGKLSDVGNGGWAGTIGYGALAQQLRRGYVAASTNTGHRGMPGEDMARFAYEHPEQLTDFAERSHHETAVKAKALLQMFYGRAADRAYFIGCSSGGYEGLMEAQRFPADFDGIVAGAPANNWTRLMAADFDATLAVIKESVSLLPTQAARLLNRSAIAACDRLDGLTDGVIDDPRQCTFDPGTLRCPGNEPSDTCLTAAQVEAARRVYRGLRDPNTGAQLYPGLEPGSELGWPNADPANPFPIPISHYKWLVFANPSWNWKVFGFSDAANYRAFQQAESRFAPLLNATDPDLSAFRRRGGKLLQYHGWIDNLIAPRNSIDYYESVIRLLGAGMDRAAALRNVQAFYRLYMVPGMGHCAGGPGPNTFDLQSALEQWVERGTAPDAVLATHSTNGVVDRSRPLCPNPQVAVYRGTGSTDDATNFMCAERSPAAAPR
jgi:Tannase and feruloyl esterase